MKNLTFKVLEILFFPITLVTAAWMKFLTLGGMHRAVIAENIFMFFGVLPIRDHYYQPLINPRKHLKNPLNIDRNLPGIDFNDPHQLEILKSFNYNDELIEIPIDGKDNSMLQPYFNNGSFGSGDAEYLYSVIRHFKPKKMIEVGSGNSTLFAIQALMKNRSLDQKYEYQHICIEPYEQPWLEKTSSSIIREKVENIDINSFKSLMVNDILFIDSSHIIRPQGDVLFEILELLPNLNSGVLVHFHDIFTPRDYLNYWIFTEHRLWNEQYLLEAFLTNNDSFEIIGALNYLKYNYREELFAKCPILAKQSYRDPGSFWIRKK